MASVDQGLSVTSIFLYTNGISADGFNLNNDMIYTDSSIYSEYRSNNSLQENDFVTQNYMLKTYYVMRGRDVDCAPITYRFWIVMTLPDTNGTYYTGTKCGLSPLTDITIISKYQA